MRAKQHAEELGQVRDLPHLVVAQGLQVVPERVLHRILETLLVVLYQTLRQQTVELVENVFLLNTAVNQNLNYFSLLLLLQVQAGQVFKGLNIVLR